MSTRFRGPFSNGGWRSEIAAVPSSRNINTTAPLSGGGALTGDITLALSDALQTAYGSGTAYTLTATPAAVVLGTTSPTLTLTNTAHYVLIAQAQIELAGATFAATRLLTILLQRTNNTPGAIANSTIAYTVPITTTLTQTLALINLPPVVYSATAADVITLWASIAVIPTAGSITVSAASLWASEVY